MTLNPPSLHHLPHHPHPPTPHPTPPTPHLPRHNMLPPPPHARNATNLPTALRRPRPSPRPTRSATGGCSKACVIRIESSAREDRGKSVRVSMSQVVLLAMEVLEACRGVGSGGANGFEGVEVGCYGGSEGEEGEGEGENGGGGGGRGREVVGVRRGFRREADGWRRRRWIAFGVMGLKWDAIPDAGYY
ncbi:hypothetical protein G7Y79_00013g035880 [Physcia stellaris]|nr:hypothetical protein G7Y79_00013g035880 [Physcia stellaris]